MKGDWGGRFLKGFCVAGLVLGLLTSVGCQKKAPEQVGDGTMGSSMPGEMETTGGGPLNDVDPAVLARGEYLVVTVMGCGDCHSPKNVSGEFMKDAWLSGVSNFVDLVPGDSELGAMSAPNLTPSLEHGLGKWTAEQIKAAVVEGVDDDGAPLHPVMPYWLYGNLTDRDADAIVAYLQSIPAVENALPPDQPMDKKLTAPTELLALDKLPQIQLELDDEAYESAHRGQYLVAIAGCADCHTQKSTDSIPIAVHKIFAGGRKFASATLGLMSPPFPMTIYSTNLTPDVNGLEGWTAEDVRVALKDGVDRDGMGVCPPMPSGPHGAYAGLEDQDALAMGHYLLNILPFDNGEIENCAVPLE